MITRIPEGVWPTMITPFNSANKIDYSGLEEIIEWYLDNQVDGLFAVCQSSEMFFLSLNERVELARFIKRQVKGRVPVIASGHISDSIEEQIEELKAMADTGVDAVVLVSNRLAKPNESDDIWKRNAERILKAVEVPLGLYECPYPYERLISPELLRWCAETGRFLFLKDTSCNVGQIRDKLAAVEGKPLKIYNANSATLLSTLKLGVAGYSGVMANYHPNLYEWLLRHWQKQPEEAEKLQDFLGLASLIELQYYPVNAKYYLQLEGLKLTLHSRRGKAGKFTLAHRMLTQQLYNLSQLYSQRYSIC